MSLICRSALESGTPLGPVFLGAHWVAIVRRGELAGGVCNQWLVPPNGHKNKWPCPQFSLQKDSWPDSFGLYEVCKRGKVLGHSPVVLWPAVYAQIILINAWPLGSSVTTRHLIRVPEYRYYTFPFSKVCRHYQIKPPTVYSNILLFSDYRENRSVFRIYNM